MTTKRERTMGFRPSPYLAAGLAALLLLAFGAATTATANDVQAIGLSVLYSDTGEDFGKFTWRVDAHNHGEQVVTISLVLVLTDEQGAVVQTASQDGVSVPAGVTITVTQTDPIRKADWDRVASHTVSVVQT